MHVSVASKAETAENIEKSSLQLLAVDVFNGRPNMRYKDILITVKSILTVSGRTAERKVARMIHLTVIRKIMLGLYEMTVNTGES